MQRKSFALAAALLLGFAGAAHAQQGDVEFGLDAGLIVSINDGTDNLTSVCIPCQRFRVGFFVSDQISFEPSLALNILSGGGETLTTFVGGPAILYHFTSDPSRARVFLGAGADIAVLDLGSATVSQFGIQGSLGVKAPAGNQLAVRLEGIVGYSFENSGDGVPSSVDLGALIGLSFFTN